MSDSHHPKDNPAHPRDAATSSRKVIKQAKAAKEAARERLARTNHAFENTRRRLQSTEEIFQHNCARREYAAEHGASPTATMPQQPSLHILLIEDSLADATLFRHVLTECGPRCQLTVLKDRRDVETFFAQATTGAFLSLSRLIITDCMIPGLEVEDIMAAVHMVPAYQQVLVILFSSLAKEEGQRRCTQCGATAFIHKPSDLEAFVEAVSTMVHCWSGNGDGADPPSTQEGRR